MGNIALFLNRAAVSLKCLNQITNKWRDTEWHQGENHDTLLNYTTASQQVPADQAFSRFQWLSQMSWSVRRPSVWTRFLRVLCDIIKNPATLVQLRRKKTKQMESVSCFPVLALFKAKFPVLPATASPTLCLIRHLPALRKAREAFAPAEKWRKFVTERMAG